MGACPAAPRGNEKWVGGIADRLFEGRKYFISTLRHPATHRPVQHATVENFPRIREILTRLLFAPEAHPDPIPSTSTTPTSSPYPMALGVRSLPGQRYHTLRPEDKVAILSFLCNLAVSSKAIHAHMETCEEQLTALRKEKIEVNRNKKQ